jgi:Uncharacterised nucleotidyltransferase
VTSTTESLTATELFAALLRGEPIPWSAFGMSADEFLRACARHDVAGLAHERLRTQPDAGWPRDVRESLARESLAQAAKELLVRKELISVLDVLAAEGIEPVLLKGTPLAYTLYGSPASRPRMDTDLMIRRSDVEPVRRVMARCGYVAPAYCDGELLFCQFPLQRSDDYGLTHTFDFHWKISTQPVFADVLGFDEIADQAVSLPSLGVHARTACAEHALLLACIHPVMHHRNTESLVWIYDVHLLASRLSPEFDRFTELAIARQVSAICAQQLRAARRWFQTSIPDSALMKLFDARALEPSAAYLHPDRRWGDELISSMEALPRWRDRMRLLREVTLPGPAYMFKAYDLPPSALAITVLPALYAHRLAAGAWKVMTGRK